MSPPSTKRTVFRNALMDEARAWGCVADRSGVMSPSGTVPCGISLEILQLKPWRVLRKLRRSPDKAGHLVKAITVLQNHRVTQPTHV